MGTLGELLLKRGLVDERVVREAEAQKLLDAEEAERAYRAAITVDDLDGTTDRKDFRELARKVLLRNPGDIDHVIKRAHRFKDDADPSWPRYIAFFYGLRDAIGRCHTDGQRTETVRLAFKKR